MKKFFLIFPLLFLWATLQAKPPELTAHDTRIKTEEILKAHASYHVLSPELMKRALLNYLEELDPAKITFLAPEIDSWINPSEDLLNQAVAGYMEEDFSLFSAMHSKAKLCFERHQALEETIDLSALPSGVQSSEFKDIKWAGSEGELIERNTRLKALQMEAASKLGADTKDLLLQRLAKRRLKRLEQLFPKDKEEFQQVVYAHVLKALSSALDSQTNYFTPAEASQFMIQVQQKLFGIGAQLRDDLNGLCIMRLLEGGPALISNKLKLNDRIIAVGSEPIVGLDITEAVEMIRGPEGTVVHLTVVREVGESEETLEIDIVRQEVVLKETRFDAQIEPFGDGMIGILKLYSFYQDKNSSSASDLEKTLHSWKQEHNLKGIVLDLRGNGGGLLTQAVAVTGLFISKGIVASVKDNTGQTQHLRNIDDKSLWKGPLVVLTNRASASASEIVAQTLQDYGRALVVGDETTYGKGTFQTFTLEAANFGKVNPKGEYKVTRGRYYTVSGKSPQLEGVHADIVVPGLLSGLDIGEKYSKFPLDNESIPAHFSDSLEDIPAAHRLHIAKLYKFNLQTIETTYLPYLEQLKKNASERILQSKNYQNFLKDVEKKDFSTDEMTFFGQCDLQLEETIRIMKDLIFLMQTKVAA